MSMIRVWIAAMALTLLPLLLPAQGRDAIATSETTANAKPYRILTSGKQITIKSTRDIKSVMVWTPGGHRIIEQKDINASNYSFRVTVDQKYIFVMVQLVDGKVYSEKIGL